jgi:hydroxymethylglutaryl-CoA reductase
MPSIANSHEEISVAKEAMGMNAVFYFGQKIAKFLQKKWAGHM